MAANLLFDRLANGDIDQNNFGGDFQDDDNGDDDNLFNWIRRKFCYSYVFNWSMNYFICYLCVLAVNI